MYERTGDMLAAHGLHAYEISNYAKANAHSRHNLAYWQGLDYIGIGPGAHGRITRDQPQRHRIATTTIKSPERWLQQVQTHGHGIEQWQPTSEQEEAQERILMGLRLSEGLRLNEIHHTHYIDLTPYLNIEKIALYQAHGLINYDGNHIAATPQGRLLLNQLLSEIIR